MKKDVLCKTATVLMLLFAFIACEKVIEVDVPSGEPKLIIDAIFEVYFDKDPVSAKTAIRLTTSADYFDNNIPTVSNATVFITNLTTNTRIPYTAINQDGIYTPNSNFIPQDDIEYQLTVIFNGETYIATHRKIKSPIITTAIQGDETLFSGEETEIKVLFTDDETQENYYVFDFDNNLYNALEDRFFNGSEYGFSYFYGEDDIELPKTVTIKLSGVTKDYYSFFRVILNQSGQNAGGPFQSVPASLIGNIVNKTNFKNFSLGYFHISETATFDVSLVKKN